MKIDTLKIEAERESKGESKTRFSQRFGLSVYGYNRILATGSTAQKRLSMIADALHMDPRDLLTR